jgi:signal transduction histidine kinase
VRLVPRLWLNGAVLPTAILLAGLLVAGQAFHLALESALDQALLTQAAAESVSLFDGQEGPHLHLGRSPLLDTVSPFAPRAELFDAAGVAVLRFPEGRGETVRGPAPAVSGPSPVLATLAEPSSRLRELVVRVRSPRGVPYALRLTASLAQLDEAVRQFHVVALGMVLATAAALVSLQLLVGRGLSRRLQGLGAHLERLRRGQLDALPGPDDSGDEVSELRAVLAETTIQLKRAREAQDRLLADAAHELRTPLTLMRTSLDLGLRRERSVPELQGALRQTRDEVDRLAHLASALLELGAASRSWDAVDADLAALVEDATEAARAEAEARGVWFELEVERPCPARFSPVAVRQALDNLLANALRYAPRGTPITVAAQSRPGGWWLEVEDHGPGIPPAKREAVFAPFHREGQGGGSGLGLAIVAEVLRQHGGRAWATEGRRGPGARVVLQVPG